MGIRICTIFIALLILFYGLFFGTLPESIYAHGTGLTGDNRHAKIPDPQFKRSMNLLITWAQTATDSIHIYDLKQSSRTFLNASAYYASQGYPTGITDITGIQHCLPLKRILLGRQEVTNIDSLYTLTNLDYLNLRYNNITNIDSLRNLTRLTYLNVSGNRVTDISVVSKLTSLRFLYLDYNRNITNIDSLYTLTSLRYLGLRYNNITNIDTLQNLTNLQRLYLQRNNVSDLSPLRNLTGLNILDLGSNNITDISPLMHLTNLGLYLIIRNNNITNLDSLSTLTNLRWLYIGRNRNLSDLSPLSNLATNLQRLYMQYTNVSDLSPLSSLTNLQRLDMDSTLVSDISVLQNKTDFQILWARNSRISDLTPLVQNPGVGGGDYIHLQGSPLSAEARNVQIPALGARGVWINYAPFATLALSSSAIDENGATTTITATLSHARTAFVTTITVSAAPGANAAVRDFRLSSNPVLTIAAGETTSTGTVTLTAVNNGRSTGDRTVTISATTSIAFTESATADQRVQAGVTPPLDVALTILDDAAPPGDAPIGEPVENKVPEFTDVVDFQRYQQGTPITPLIFPEAQSGDGALIYTLGALPDGLTYTPPSDEDAHGGVLSGTPTAAQAKTTYALTATDEDEDVARALFFIVVTTDRMPSFGDATVASQRYVQNQEIEAITVPQATGGDGVLTYALSPDLPEGLTFNTETRVLSGLPLESLDETTYTWTVADSDGDEATLRFTIAIAEDLMPAFADTTIAHRCLIGSEVEITFPEATGGDGELAYILLPYLPEELQFDHETRMISGALLQAILGTEYTLSALDADGDVASLVFTLEGLTPDFDGNGRVNFADFILFVINYGTQLGEERYNSRYDLNMDDEVGFDDFFIFVQYYDTDI